MNPHLAFLLPGAHAYFFGPGCNIRDRSDETLTLTVCLLIFASIHFPQVCRVMQGGALATEPPSPSASATPSPLIAQAKTLLRDWMVLLSAGYQRALHPK